MEELEVTNVASAATGTTGATVVAAVSEALSAALHTAIENEATVEEAENASTVEDTTEDTAETTGTAHYTIPENSESINVRDNTARFRGASWFEEMSKTNITLAGLGGIGSWTAFLLSRMNPNSLKMYDGDTVDTVNMSGQLYSSSDVSEYKAYALKGFLHNYSDFYSVYGMNRFFDAHDYGTPIMICGFDNMNARRLFYNSWKEVVQRVSAETRKSHLFIDGRMSAEEFQIFCITGDDTYHMKKYEEEWLFSDEEADATICSYKQTTYMASMIGSMITNLVINFVANKCNPLVPRDLPFFTSYDGETMYLKTEL